ncbi:hypothetical protein, partial [Streptococcus anginosus]|uniref:hypothetical protein n=1 Tax=Streptococcus anginosus TaxID=1328 RepID=UPI002ED9B7F0
KLHTENSFTSLIRSDTEKLSQKIKTQENKLIILENQNANIQFEQKNVKERVKTLGTHSAELETRVTKNSDRIIEVKADVTKVATQVKDMSSK